jgi:3-oxoacyl-[acyl-carrier-protein] synthase-3
MTAISLLGVASDLPERAVTNEFFAEGTRARRGMFTAPTTRRHVSRDETAADMLERASQRLVAQLDLRPERDIDIVFTNVAVPDQAFTGCGAELAHRIGCRPRFVVDLHNSGCVSFIYMLELARMFLGASDARGALLCCVQNAGGRVFSDPEVRLTSQAPIPGDGAGVGFVAKSDVSPIVTALHACHGEFARDMTAEAADGRRYWEPGASPLRISFTEERVASIISRGNRMVPEIVREACKQAGLPVHGIDLLITNQPNPIFLRNWREALELPPDRHHDTFDRFGNLFGAAIPIGIEDALRAGKLSAGKTLVLGGFAHAGDYSAAAVIRWQVSGSVTG